MDDLWRETFLNYAGTPTHEDRVNHAKEIIRKALEEERCYVGYSGGKDSTAMLHLVLQQCRSILVVHWDYGPGFMPREIEEAIIANARAIGAKNLSIHTSEKYQEFHRPDFAVFAREYIGRVLPRLRSRGYSCSFVGLRAEESCKRKRRIKRREYIVTREAWPLADWTWMDVWAHIISNDLPYLSHYDRAAELAGSYRDVRLCTLFDAQFAHMGGGDNFLYWHFRNA